MRGLSAISYPPATALGRRVSFRELSWLVPLALFVATLVLYVATRSISLDDFDSFNFARAIDRFDVRVNQPQPPGYPVYVFLARLFDLAVRNHQLALTLLSAVSGAVAVLALYGVAGDLGVPWAAVPLALAPLFWLSSGMALSDVPGLALASLAVFVAQRNPRDRRYLVTASGLTALTLGLRPQTAIVPVSVLLLVLGRSRPSRWDRAMGRDVILAGGVFLSAALVWAIPLTISLGGPLAAWRVLAGQSAYVGATDSLLSRPLTLANVEVRLAEFGSVFSAYFGGPLDGGLPAFLALAGAVALLSVLAGKARWLALTWLLPYSAFMILFLRPDDPRKVLPAIPPMLLLLAAARPRPLAAAASVAAAGWFAFSAAPLITTLDNVKAPPEQAAAYVARSFSPQDTLILAGSSYNAIRYRDPAFRAYLLDDLDQAAVDDDLAGGAYRNLVVLDKEGFTVPENYVGVDSRTFQRDPLVLPKASTVWLAAYRPLHELRDRDLALPGGSVLLGTPDDVRYALEGWYRPEIIAGVQARWADKQARLRFWLDQPTNATLNLAGVAFPSGQQLTVLVNGLEVARLPMATDWAPYTISVPATALQSNAINIITLQHSQAVSAYDVSRGQSLDRRPLAAAYSSFELIRQ